MVPWFHSMELWNYGLKNYDYDYLRELLYNILKKENACNDYYFDWNKQKPNIDEDAPIFTNDYHIEYNGKNE